MKKILELISRWRAAAMVYEFDENFYITLKRYYLMKILADRWRKRQAVAVLRVSEVNVFVKQNEKADFAN